MFKIHPLYDRTLRDLLISVPDAHLAVLGGRRPRWTELFLQRLQSTLGPDLSQRLHLIERVSSEQFFGVLRIADVVLHPFPFDGSKTSADALFAGKPIVTLPTEYLRGRMGAAFLRTMNLSELVAHSAAHYVDIARRLKQEPGFYAAMQRGVVEQLPLIWEDMEVPFRWTQLLQTTLGMGPLAGSNEISPKSSSSSTHTAISQAFDEDAEWVAFLEQTGRDVAAERVLHRERSRNREAFDAAWGPESYMLDGGVAVMETFYPPDVFSPEQEPRIFSNWGGVGWSTPPGNDIANFEARNDNRPTTQDSVNKSATSPGNALSSSDVEVATPGAAGSKTAFAQGHNPGVSTADNMSLRLRWRAPPPLKLDLLGLADQSISSTTNTIPSSTVSSSIRTNIIPSRATVSIGSGSVGDSANIAETSVPAPPSAPGTVAADGATLSAPAEAASNPSPSPSVAITFGDDHDHDDDYNDGRKQYIKLASTGRYDEAYIIAQRLEAQFQQQEKNGEARAMGDTMSAWPAARGARSYGRDAIFLLELGAIQYFRGEYREAHALCTQAQSLAPTASLVFACLGVSGMYLPESGRETIQAFSKALSLMRSKRAARVERGLSAEYDRSVLPLTGLIDPQDGELYSAVFKITIDTLEQNLLAAFRIFQQYDACLAWCVDAAELPPLHLGGAHLLVFALVQWSAERRADIDSLQLRLQREGRFDLDRSHVSHVSHRISSSRRSGSFWEEIQRLQSSVEHMLNPANECLNGFANETLLVDALQDLTQLVFAHPLSQDEDKLDNGFVDAGPGSGIALITQYFLPSNPLLKGDVDAVLLKNLLNRAIADIYLLNEQEYNFSSFPFSEKIHQVVLGERLTFQRAFGFANEQLGQRTVILGKLHCVRVCF